MIFASPNSATFRPPSTTRVTYADTLDKLQIPNKEQKELLSIIESTRPQIVTER